MARPRSPSAACRPLTPVETEHFIPCWGFRAEADGRLLGYTADTGPGEAVVEDRRWRGPVPERGHPSVAGRGRTASGATRPSAAGRGRRGSAAGRCEAPHADPPPGRWGRQLGAYGGFRRLRRRSGDRRAVARVRDSGRRQRADRSATARSRRILLVEAGAAIHRSAPQVAGAQTLLTTRRDGHQPRQDGGQPGIAPAMISVVAVTPADDRRHDSAIFASPEPAQRVPLGPPGEPQDARAGRAGQRGVEPEAAEQRAYSPGARRSDPDERPRRQQGRECADPDQPHQQHRGGTARQALDELASLGLDDLGRPVAGLGSSVTTTTRQTPPRGRRAGPRRLDPDADADQRRRHGQGDPATEAWVIGAGTSMSDSTAPSDSARVKSRVAATSRGPPPRRRGARC